MLRRGQVEVDWFLTTLSLRRKTTSLLVEVFIMANPHWLTQSAVSFSRADKGKGARSRVIMINSNSTGLIGQIQTYLDASMQCGFWDMLAQLSHNPYSSNPCMRTGHPSLSYTQL